MMTNEALEQLEALFEKGWEWPDASAKVAAKHGVDQDELAAEWDAYLERSKHGNR